MCVIRQNFGLYKPEYKTIPPHKRYEITKDGKIRHRSTGQELALDINYKVRINTKFYYAANLIALAFIGKCPAGQKLIYKDGDRTNIKLDNLRYE